MTMQPDQPQPHDSPAIPATKTWLYSHTSYIHIITQPHQPLPHDSSATSATTTWYTTMETITTATLAYCHLSHISHNRAWHLCGWTGSVVSGRPLGSGSYSGLHLKGVSSFILPLKIVWFTIMYCKTVVISYFAKAKTKTMLAYYLHNSELGHINHIPTLPLLFLPQL